MNRRLAAVAAQRTAALANARRDLDATPTPPPAPDAPLVYSFDELVAALRVGKHVIREWMARRDDPLPYVRTYRVVLFPRDLVRDWLHRQAVGAVGATGATR